MATFGAAMKFGVMALKEALLSENSFASWTWTGPEVLPFEGTHDPPMQASPGMIRRNWCRNKEPLALLLALVGCWESQRKRQRSR
jgi:hypothetical protein